VNRSLIWHSFLASILSLLALAVLAGCALTPGQVDVAYTPAASTAAPTRVTGAETAAVRVVVDDQRPSKTIVGHKMNGFGMETAAITSNVDVPKTTLQSAIESELTSRGFTIADSGVPVDITLTKFESHFRAGMWSGTAAAEVVMNVAVKGGKGSIVYTKLIDAEGINKPIEMYSPANAQIALDRALQNAVADLFADNNFVAALETAGQGAPSAVRAGPAEAASLPPSPVQPETNPPPSATPQ
jgi:uncharacterized lipoprotein